MKLTEYQKRFIQNNVAVMPIRGLAKYLNVPHGTVVYYMTRKGLKAPQTSLTRWRNTYKPFTPEEDQYIHDNIRTMSSKAMAKEIKRSPVYILKRARELGYGEVMRQKRIDSNFKPGMVPFNKGKKMADVLSPEAMARTVKTRFQKGDIPPNATYDGCRRLRKYEKDRFTWWIRLGPSNWEPYSRVLWERHHGPIPDNGIIVFRDGDPENCALENLEMITMQENMLRQSRHDIPEEIIPTMALKAQLKKAIQKHENK